MSKKEEKPQTPEKKKEELTNEDLDHVSGGAITDEMGTTSVKGETPAVVINPFLK
jgi:bacteriocin-like protein